MTNAPAAASDAPIFGLAPRRLKSRPALSVVVPMFDEAGGARRLVEEIGKALSLIDHEIIVVDDGSRDKTVDELIAAKKLTPRLRVVRHGANAGQSRAVRTGVFCARAAVIATLDGDGQNDPADISALYHSLIRANAPDILAMVAGERRQRLDAAAKKTASRLANKIRRAILDDGSADTGCGLKVFYRDAYLRLPYFDHAHRYLPALMKREGFAVEFLPVGHRAREHGASKYNNLGRLAVAFRDLLGVVWLKARAKSPLTISELEPSADYDTM
ncbi:MAG: glycosyltransferase family 2 protein [Pseudomonadota bacterium]